jgi:hypothetical protein
MEFDFSKMTACDEHFYGVVSGKAAYPIGWSIDRGVPRDRLAVLVMNPQCKR